MRANPHVRFGERDGRDRVWQHTYGASVPTPCDPQPSREDCSLTRRLVQAGQLLGIDVLDHVIIGDGTADYYSFADQGILHTYKGESHD